MPTKSTPFEIWHWLLRHSCEKHGKLREFESLSQHILTRLWEQGLDPTFDAITGGGITNHAHTNSHWTPRARSVSDLGQR